MNIILTEAECALLDKLILANFVSKIDYLIYNRELTNNDVIVKIADSYLSVKEYDKLGYLIYKYPKALSDDKWLDAVFKNKSQSLVSLLEVIHDPQEVFDNIVRHQNIGLMIQSVSAIIEKKLPIDIDTAIETLINYEGNNFDFTYHFSILVKTVFISDYDKKDILMLKFLKKIITMKNQRDINEFLPLIKHYGLQDLVCFL